MVPAEDRVQALMGGAADAAWIDSPGHLQLPEGEYERVAGNARGFSGGAMMFGPELLNERPDVGQAFVRAMARTVAEHLQGDYKQDPAIVEQIAEVLEIDTDTVTSTPSVLYNEKQEFPTEPVTRLQELWIEVGGLVEIDEPLEPEQLVDMRFLDAVYAK